jgi:putative phosphoesterase
MRIGIVSDIHCNHAGLAAALEQMGPVDELLCAGDSVLEYRLGNEALELLRERNARCVLGNHEIVLLGPHGERARAMPHVRRENLDWLAALPLRVELEIAGKRILMVHGSPFDPWDEYIYPGSRELKKLAEVDADYLIYGHTHCQLAERIGKVMVINPGSAGDARDHRNGRALSYAVLDLASDEVKIGNYRVSETPA